MGEHVYDLIVAAALGGIAVLLAAVFAGLWVMRRRIIDTQLQLQREREERIHEVGELRSKVVRDEYERKLAALEDDDEPPEERRRRFYIVPLAAPIALLAAAGTWLRAHLWTPARTHPWVAAGGAAMAAIAMVIYAAPGADSGQRAAEPIITTAPTTPAPRDTPPADSAAPDRTPPGRATVAGRRGSPIPSPTTAAPPAPVSRASPPASSPPADRTSAPGTANGGTTGGDTSTGGTSGSTDGGSTGDPTTGGTTPPVDPPDEDDDRDSLLCLDADLAPILRLGLCLL